MGKVMQASKGQADGKTATALLRSRRACHVPFVLGMDDDELGPDSILWQYAGDTRIAFMGATIGLLQLMHPAIGAGVMEHSDFFGDPYDRVFRSLPAILGAVYDGPTPTPPADGCATSTRRSRASTRRAAATTPSPRRRTGGRTPRSSSWPSRSSTATTTVASPTAEREQLYQEGLVWYRRYGVSDRDVPRHRGRVPGALGPLLRRGPRDERGGRVRAAAAAQADPRPAPAVAASRSRAWCVAARCPASSRCRPASARSAGCPPVVRAALRHPVDPGRPAPARRPRARRPQDLAASSRSRCGGSPGPRTQWKRVPPASVARWPRLDPRSGTAGCRAAHR